jgi:rhodanese-related sulfurtransferase
VGFFWWLPFGSVPEISVGALAKAVKEKKGPLIVDVRSPSEFGSGHIQGAKSLSIGQLKGALAAGEIPSGQAIVAICLSAHRSIPAVRLLRANGFENAVQLAGGMMAWKRAGMPVTTKR